MSSTYPFTKQLDEMDCGAACLQMVTAYYQRKFPLPYLKQLTHTTTEGVSLLDISEAAEKLGMRSLAATVNYEQLQKEIPLPAIIFWEGYHFVVAFEVTDKKVVVGNPAADSIITLSKQEFLYSWSEDEGPGAKGIVLALEPKPEFFRSSEGQTGKRKRNYFWQNLKNYSSLLWQVGIGVLLISLLQFALPFLIKSLVDIGIGQKNINFIWLVMGGMGVLLLSQVLLELLRGAIINHIGTHLNITLLTDHLVKIIRLPARYFQRFSTGDLMQRMADHDRMDHLLHSSALYHVFSVLTILSFSVILLIFDCRVFVVFAVGTLLYLIWVRLFLKKKRELNFKKFEQEAAGHNYLLDIFQGIQDIKLFQAERQRRWSWERIQAKLSVINAKSLQLEMLQSRGAYFINELKNLVVVGLTAYAVIENEMTLGMMLATMFILGQLNGPVNALVEFFLVYQDTAISLERLSEIETIDEEVEKPENKPFEIGDGAIQVEDVSFKYGGSGVPYVLQDVNFTLPKGKITALVGPSGSGKTTFLKILLGLLEPESGNVRVGEAALKMNHLDFWLDKVSAVLDDGHIFNDTIGRNIALGNELVDQSRLEEVARLANLGDYLEGLPLKYNTVIGESGAGLSQGIRQRLLLARALYKNADYLFLDEATNALDAYNEMLIMENIRDAFPGKTILFVAHRLSTIQFADNIVVMENGRILETGSHEELYAKKGAYFNLVRRQVKIG
ncbi:MAG: peptidase domain-containing ABC transporter [Saprospiraceae bacterium]|nr:peptidase domain-containing ABC transporter [Saprospiraceae bacterium]